jgi:hypothetical protein
MADDLPKSIVDQPLYSPLLEACRQRMLQLFGSVQAVIRSDTLVQGFCELPYSAGIDPLTLSHSLTHTNSQTWVVCSSVRMCVCVCVCVLLCAVKLWARLDELRVDNENSVAVLISHWWLHNHPTAVRSPAQTPRIGGTGSLSGQAPGAGTQSQPTQGQHNADITHTQTHTHTRARTHARTQRCSCRL